MTMGTPERLEVMARALRREDGRSLAPSQARIRFVADLACPWCYVAFRRLQRLLAQHPAQLVWHPFLLNPHLPAEGVTRTHYLERKFGSLIQAQGTYRRIAEVGTSEGIRFSFGSIRTQPNTVLAHALVLAATERGRLPAAAGAVFRAFFEEGADIGDPATLLTIAQALNLVDAAGPNLADPARLEQVASAHEQAYALGINGVPVCIFGNDHVIAGAQPLKALEALLDLERYRVGDAGG
jgi:predicted DsbA family dithiol-disulfide isomerase